MLGTGSQLGCRYNDVMPKLVLGVTGSIAAYKSADLASMLVKHGVEVYPVLTRSAAQLIAPATFHALTTHPCPIDVFDEPFPGEIAHIHLATIADLFVVAPATANTLAKAAAGFADDMLSASLLATQAPVLVAPAMNTKMWEHPATVANMQILTSCGYTVVQPVPGRLACGTEGIGKMADVETIFERICELLASRGDFAGKRVLVTAGPTREPLDPVRFISNRSSGKMGYALANAAAQRGADVVLVSGPVALAQPRGVRTVYVETASEMLDAATSEFDTADYVLAVAAVADFKPANSQTQKVKKGEASLDLRLEETTDIVKHLGSKKRAGQRLLGFAAETAEPIPAARKKLVEKNLDWIVVNDVTVPGAGFDSDTNVVTMLWADGRMQSIPKLHKDELAHRLLDLISPEPNSR